MNVVKRRSAPDEVRERLRNAILSGEFSAGEQLRQTELAERFGTSRIPVREALRQLEAEGLISLLPNKGAMVSSPSLPDINELLEVRIALECHALRLAIPNMFADDFDQAEAILRACDAHDYQQAWSELNWQFHEALYAPCNLGRLLAMIEANYEHVRLFMAQVSITSAITELQKEHYAILNACKTRDTVQAVRILEGHIVHTQKLLLAASRRVRLVRSSDSTSATSTAVESSRM
ncbi:GntR family transcriptional regulator [Bradyrhizobium sp. BWA-3-5]|uniref:GntR family transcriptional regulator n=1 Tax=Bradyrhizobium sp. BWA-3-5 TaxID=3080013 RepID=UPI00293ED04E|nr:GntR family transcriptional regulator [Bradyrhizobium sp. BWA-3-5]WOH63747.1 GntR family transcriptional regulator [Bradyrhizobium sp. BWA-3-5]